MCADHLNGLALICMHQEIKPDVNLVINKFAAIGSRRREFLCTLCILHFILIPKPIHTSRRKGLLFISYNDQGIEYISGLISLCYLVTLYAYYLVNLY